MLRNSASGRLLVEKASQPALPPARGRPEGRFRCFGIRPGIPISGPEALLRKIGQQLLSVAVLWVLNKFKNLFKPHTPPPSPLPGKGEGGGGGGKGRSLKNSNFPAEVLPCFIQVGHDLFEK